MDTEKIIQDLNRRFAEPLPEFYKRRIIFWYDEDQEFADKLDDIQISNAKMVVLTGTNNFEVKKLLNVDDTTSNYLVYSPFSYDNQEDNWFLDIELYSEEFRSDLISIWMDELKVPQTADLRSGFKKYYYGNAIAVVIVTFFLFTVPFLLELLLSAICFSSRSVADPSGVQLYVTLPEEKKNLLYQVYIVSPYLYGFLMTIRFGLISCVFAFFNYAFSTSPKIKYKMITMIPLLGTLYFLMIIDRFVPAKLSYLMFMPMFEYRNVSEGFYLAGYIGMLAIAILELILNEKRYYSLQG